MIDFLNIFDKDSLLLFFKELLYALSRICYSWKISGQQIMWRQQYLLKKPHVSCCLLADIHYVPLPITYICDTLIFAIYRSGQFIGWTLIGKSKFILSTTKKNQFNSETVQHLQVYPFLMGLSQLTLGWSYNFHP